MKTFGVLLCGGPVNEKELEPFSFNNLHIKFYTTSQKYDPSDIEMIVGYRFDRELLHSLPNLRLIHIPFAGVDIVDLSIVKERGVPLSNSHLNAKAVAEFTVSLLFSLIKRIPEFDRYMRKGIWKGRWEKEVLDDFYGKTGTILGFGSIGKEIAHMLKPFGMKLFAVKRKIRNSDAKYNNIVEALGTGEDLLEFLRKSDFLVISLPLTPETKGLINKEVLDALGYGYIVNISRGGVIEEETLYTYLKERKLKGVALDVWWNYPKRENRIVYPSNFPFWELDNVIMTPHTAGVTHSFLKELKKEIITIIKEVALGGLPENLIDLSLGY